MVNKNRKITLFETIIYVLYIASTVLYFRATSGYAFKFYFIESDNLDFIWIGLTMGAVLVNYYSMEDSFPRKNAFVINAIIWLIILSVAHIVSTYY